VQFRMASRLTAGETPTYVPRTVDGQVSDAIDRALAAGPDDWKARLVLIAGPPKAGKTRTALEILKRQAPSCLVLAKHPDPRCDIAKLGEALGSAGESGILSAPKMCLFVEDLHLLLGRGSNVAIEIRRLLEGLRANDQQLILLSTIDQAYLDFSHSSASRRGFGTEEMDTLRSCSIPMSGELELDEELSAASIHPALLSEGHDLHHLPSLMASVDVLLERAQEAMSAEESYVNHALLNAALDLFVVEPGGGTIEQLRQLTDRWVQELSPTRMRPTATSFDEAVRWATEPVGSWAIINPQRGGDPTEDRMRLLDALGAILVECHTQRAWLGECLSSRQICRLAVALLGAGKPEEFIAVAMGPASNGDADAMYYVADAYGELNDLEAQTLWTDRAVEAGHPLALEEYASNLWAEGDLAGAEEALIRTYEAGLHGTAINIATLRFQAGDLDGAEHWGRLAADSGHHNGLIYYGLLLFDLGRPSEAEGVLLEAASGGSVLAVGALGKFLALEGRFTEAEPWLQDCAERGDVDAARGLSQVLASLGRMEESDVWLREAADRGDSWAMTRLGSLLLVQGMKEQARTWLEAAGKTGSADALNALGVLLDEEGDVEGARICYQQAFEAGSEQGLANLGLLNQDVAGRPNDNE
ncbi:MAG: hypothetical protein WCI34_07125, partial [Actinomycetes bacterium]